MTMKLLMRGPSPFGRKGIYRPSRPIDRIDIGDPDSEDHVDLNPLAKVPALVRDDGDAHRQPCNLGSRHLAGGGGVIPTDTGPRFNLPRSRDGGWHTRAATWSHTKAVTGPTRNPTNPGSISSAARSSARSRNVGRAAGVDLLTVGGIGRLRAGVYGFPQTVRLAAGIPALAAWLENSMPAFADSTLRTDGKPFYADAHWHILQRIPPMAISRASMPLPIRTRTVSVSLMALRRSAGQPSA